MRIRPAHYARDLLRSRLISHPPHQYEPLPSPRAIRLLQVHPSSSEHAIRCSLKSFDQGSVPPYHALSYTWIYPLTPFSELSGTSSFHHLKALRKIAREAPPNVVVEDGRASRDEDATSDARCFPISCDGRTLLVTANLHDALRTLVRMGDKFFGGQQLAQTAGSGPDASEGPRYLWIDAVCVDQANIAERNAQVAMMANIFREAQGILGWLGMEDQFTADAMALIEAIAEMPREAFDATRYTDFFNPDWQAAAGGLTHRHWLAFLGLLSRPWFCRAWVVQELALARDAILVCGDRAVHWRKLDRVLDFIRRKRWYHHLSTDKISHLDSMGKPPDGYGGLLRSGSALGMGAINLFGTRRWMTKTGTSNLEVLMKLHRETRATDPRDKVYAFLGLTDGACSAVPRAGGEATQEFVEPLQPDYKLPVQEIYTDVTRRFMLNRGDLWSLSRVQDASSTNIRGLPSWVPDYSVALEPYRLAIRGKLRWDACGDLRWKPDVAAMHKGQLRVQGLRIGVVQEAALMPDEARDSARYWANVIRLAASLDDYQQMVPPAGTPDPQPRPQSRFEVFWRTLITDTYSREHPAPAWVGTLALDYAVNLQIRHTLAPWTNGDFVPHQSPTNPSTTQAGRTAWPRLFAAEPPGSPYGPDMYRQRITSVVEGMLKGEYHPIGLSQLQHEFDIASGKMRRVFCCARTGIEGGSTLLGTGPRSLREGDEVWILAGAAVPFVLRRTAAPRAKETYTLVGETYVHGAMYWDRAAGNKNGLGREEDLVDLILQ